MKTPGGPEIKQRHVLDGRVSEKEQWASLADYLLFLRHQKAYLFAEAYCRGKTVLDYGCGNGYGSFLLARAAKNVTAVDINPTIIETCGKKYPAANLSFATMAPETRTGFADQNFDVIVSFQVIEHVHHVSGYLTELKRMLKNDGILLLTTPNRKYRLYPLQKPVNPFHLREYDYRSLSRQLTECFSQVAIRGIAGTEEIQRIERKRVNKTMVNAFLRQPARRLLHKWLMQSTLRKKNASGRSGSKAPVAPETMNRFNPEDYTITAENFDTCLDFLALLGKSAAATGLDARA
jgi:2-polyprenyl-3-methyl-5-hydroxy-6-metoxy-1,4-benzoquinol methylase